MTTAQNVRETAEAGRVTPVVIGWLQRALRHEFAAARQFTLQAVVARRLGDAALAQSCERSAVEELQHAQRFAAELVAAGAALGDGAPVNLPVGATLDEILANARATERQAVQLYRDGARASRGLGRPQRVFEDIGAEEAAHLESLMRR